MTTKQAQKVLDELKGAKPEELKGEAKRLFEAIMKIADERDELKEKIEDKIEELKQEKKKYGNCLITIYENELVDRDIQVLQELLEK